MDIHLVQICPDALHRQDAVAYVAQRALKLSICRYPTRPSLVFGTSCMPMVFIVVGFLFWGWVYGPFGALLAVPLTLLVRMLLESSQATHLRAGLMRSVDEEEAEEAPSGNGEVSSAPVTP